MNSCLPSTWHPAGACSRVAKEAANQKRPLSVHKGPWNLLRKAKTMQFYAQERPQRALSLAPWRFQFQRAPQQVRAALPVPVLSREPSGPGHRAVDLLALHTSRAMRPGTPPCLCAETKRNGPGSSSSRGSARFRAAPPRKRREKARKLGSDDEQRDEEVNIQSFHIFPACQMPFASSTATSRALKPQ